jgi:hypothetical protein
MTLIGHRRLEEEKCGENFWPATPARDSATESGVWGLAGSRVRDGELRGGREGMLGSGNKDGDGDGSWRWKNYCWRDAELGMKRNLNAGNRRWTFRWKVWRIYKGLMLFSV